MTVKPSGIEFDAVDGQTLMAAGQAAGYRWPTICGGQGECLVCHVEVLDHPGNLTEPDQAEAEAIRNLSGDHGGRGQHVRLACQAGVRGDIVVLKRGVRARRAGEESADAGR
ncbi:2Fe-2S iron-sulfur cluster-binding protein [Mycolicibacterium sp. XJ870]